MLNTMCFFLRTMLITLYACIVAQENVAFILLALSGQLQFLVTLNKVIVTLQTVI